AGFALTNLRTPVARAIPYATVCQARSICATKPNTAHQDSVFRSGILTAEPSMLTCLRVRDLAIIDQLELELGPGLNVITGKTCAGKCILVDALELVLGGKGRAEMVRSGATQAEVEALFDVSGDPDMVGRLRELGVEGEQELVICRVLLPNGRTR